MEMGVKKLMNTSQSPSYKVTLPVDDFLSNQVMLWRQYLAKNLDKSPEALLNSDKLRILIHEIRRKRLSNKTEELADLLNNLNVMDDSHKAARLLTAYLDPSATQLQKMKSIICHRCNVEGHTVRDLLLLNEVVLLINNFKYTCTCNTNISLCHFSGEVLFHCYVCWRDASSQKRISVPTRKLSKNKRTK